MESGGGGVEGVVERGLGTSWKERGGREGGGGRGRGGG